MSPKKFRKADFCVIGAGSAGLSFAAGAAQMGASVILVERGKMGGDCLNYGCIPSKALIAAAKFRHELNRSKNFGWDIKSFGLNFKHVHDHVHQVIGSIAPHDSEDRFEKLGVKVINRKGQFKNKDIFETERHTIQAKRYIIATGSSPYIPPIPGLQDVEFYTNETIFDLQSLPERLVVIGGGPIGIELAQAFYRFGTKVTVLEASTVLPKDDSEVTSHLLGILRSEGIDIKEQIHITQIKKDNHNIIITYKDQSAHNHVINASHILLATGRRANIKELNLPAAGIDILPSGIKVNKQLRTTNPRVYAIGDCIGGYQFTHVAGYHAGIALRNSIFHLHTKVQTIAIPWVTFTDPELAHVGALESQLLQDNVNHRVLRFSFNENDRAQVERRTEGMIKVLTTPRGHVLGATILGTHAGDLIFPWVMAIQNRLKLSSIVNTIAPYPTLAEINKSVAGTFYKEKLFSPRMKCIVQSIMKMTK
jgi:pyruvate/2-oxoglutarate dehydrogenase complex dihydrolipoamide dehydrogenase (E3) component